MGEDDDWTVTWAGSRAAIEFSDGRRWRLDRCPGSRRTRARVFPGLAPLMTTRGCWWRGRGGGDFEVAVVFLARGSGGRPDSEGDCACAGDRKEKCDNDGKVGIGPNERRNASITQGTWRLARRQLGTRRKENKINPGEYEDNRGRRKRAVIEVRLRCKTTSITTSFLAGGVVGRGRVFGWTAGEWIRLSRSGRQARWMVPPRGDLR